MHALSIANTLPMKEPDSAPSALEAMRALPFKLLRCHVARVPMLLLARECAPNAQLGCAVVCRTSLQRSHAHLAHIPCKVRQAARSVPEVGCVYSGSFCPLTTEPPSQCPPGSYSALKATECALCPAGHSCARPHELPIPCSPRKTYALEGSGRCEACPPGHECPRPHSAPRACLEGFAEVNGFCREMKPKRLPSNDQG